MQLLVNYGAEKFLALYRDSLYRHEEGLYRSEGIASPPVSWWDNEGVVKIVESHHRPVGILETIDEAFLYNLSDSYVCLFRLPPSTRLTSSLFALPHRLFDVASLSQQLPVEVGCTEAQSGVLTATAQQCSRGDHVHHSTLLVHRRVLRSEPVGRQPGLRRRVWRRR